MSSDPNQPKPSNDAAAASKGAATDRQTVNLVTGQAVSEPADPSSNANGDAAVPPTPAAMDRYECRACGYTYEPTKGDNTADIPPGTEFESLPASWRCPVCGAPTRQFSNMGPTGAPSGFKENLNYGLGVNAMTPGQKNILIFGALGAAVIFFLSLYGLR